MKLVTYNIRFGLGTDQKIDLERIADTVTNADIIALQEVERNWQRSGMKDQPEIFSKHLKNYYWVFFPAFDVDASKANGDGSVVNRRRQFGSMALSRWPIRMARYILFPKFGTIDWFNMDLGAIECIVDTPSGPLLVYSLHLSAVSSRDRLSQIDRPLDFYRSAPESGGPWTGGFTAAADPTASVLTDQDWSNGGPESKIPKEAVMMGDLNFTPENEEYDRMVGSPGPYYDRLAHVDELFDSWTSARARTGDRVNWHPDPPESEPGHPICLDYCFISPILSKNVDRVWVDRQAVGSDHRPYWVELNSEFAQYDGN